MLALLVFCSWLGMPGACAGDTAWIQSRTSLACCMLPCFPCCLMIQEEPCSTPRFSCGNFFSRHPNVFLVALLKACLCFSLGIWDAIVMENHHRGFLTWPWASLWQNQDQGLSCQVQAGLSCQNPCVPIAKVSHALSLSTSIFASLGSTKFNMYDLGHFSLRWQWTPAVRPWSRGCCMTCVKELTRVGRWVFLSPGRHGWPTPISMASRQREFVEVVASDRLMTDCHREPCQGSDADKGSSFKLLC